MSGGAAEGAAAEPIPGPRHVAGLLALVACILLAVAVGLGPGSEGARMAILDVAMAVAGALAAWACQWRSRRTDRPWAWRLLAAGGVLAMAGNLLWAPVHAAQGPSAGATYGPAEALFFAGYASVFAAFAAFVVGESSARDLARRVADAVVIGVSLTVIVWLFFLRDLALPSDLGGGSLALLVAYPTIDAAIGAVLLVLAAEHTGARRQRFLWMSLGMAGFLVGDVSLAFDTLVGGPHGASALTVAWVAGYLCFALAAWSGPPTPDPGGATGQRSRLADVAVYGPLAFLLPVALLTFYWRGQALDGVTFGFGIVLVTALGARQGLQAADLEAGNRALLAREARLRETQRRAHIGSWERDLRTGGATWSEETWRLLGLPVADRPPSAEEGRRFVHPEDLGRFQAAAAACLGAPGQFEVEHRVLRADGEVRWVRTIGTSVAGPDGVPDRFIGSTQDITSLKQATVEASRNAAERSAVLAAIPDLVFVFDTVDRFSEAFAGPGAEPFAPPPDVLGKRPRDVMPPEAATLLEEALARGRATGSTQELAYDLPSPDGVKHFEARVAPVGDGRMLALARDVTQRVEAELRYRLLAENAGDLVQLFDADGVCLYASPSSETVLGYRPDELVGHDGLHLLDPADAAAVRAGKVGQPRPDGSIVTEARARRKDGTMVWIETVTRAQLGPDGKPASFRSATRDITARRDAEERFKLAGQATTDVIWDYDVPNDRLVWGGSMEEVFGHRPSEMEPGLESWSLRVHPDDLDQVSASFGNALAGTATKWNGAYRFRRADGRWADVLDRCFIVRDAAGRAVRAVGSFSDVTELLRMEREREAALHHAEDQRREAERQKEMAEFKTQFLNMAAHDLATPITPLKLQLATLEAGAFGALEPRQRDALGLLSRNVNRLGNLVTDLLDAARLQSGQLRLRIEDASLREVAADCVASFSQPARDAGVLLALEVADEVRARCDPARMAQVLTNLVSNAVKFTPRGGQVRVSVAVEGGAAVLRVRDDGVGLTREQMDRLFQPFVQVHDPAKVRVGGTGLGLYITQGILEQHGASIGVASDGPGHGTTFTVRLPLKTAAVPPPTRPG